MFGVARRLEHHGIFYVHLDGLLDSLDSHPLRSRQAEGAWNTGSNEWFLANPSVPGVTGSTTLESVSVCWCLCVCLKYSDGISRYCIPDEPSNWWRWRACPRFSCPESTPIDPIDYRPSKNYDLEKLVP